MTSIFDKTTHKEVELEQVKVLEKIRAEEAHPEKGEVYLFRLKQNYAELADLKRRL